MLPIIKEATNLDLHNHIPLYKRLTEYYRSKIISQELKPGTKLDSINRMMTRHSVSRETAKRVIKNLVDEKLVVSQAGRGTFINGNVEINKVWGMVVPFYSSNIEQLILNVSKQANKEGFTLKYFLHYNNAEEEQNIIGKLIKEGYHSIVIVPNSDESSIGAFYRQLMPGNTNIVLADSTMSGSYFKYVIQSYSLGVKRAIDYITTKQKGNYLLLNNENWQGHNMVFDLMKKTFNHLLESHQPYSKLFHVADINELSAEYFKANNIKGILSIQDSLSIRLISRLLKWGFKIPEDITLVSYGNTELTEIFKPSITVVDCSYDEMASNIAELILSDEKRKKQIMIQPKLIIRET